jgi:predicted DNA-binding transcriptional regulator AlpA
MKRKREHTKLSAAWSKRNSERGECRSVKARTRGDPRRDWVTGSTLRKRLNISAVTLWRWRHGGNFPLAKSINGRLFFSWDEVEAWLDAQPDAHPCQTVPRASKALERRAQTSEKRTS